MSKSFQCHASKNVLCLEEALMPRAQVRKLAFNGGSGVTAGGEKGID